MQEWYGAMVGLTFLSIRGTPITLVVFTFLLLDIASRLMNPPTSPSLSSKAKPPLKKVGVLIDTATSWGRDIIAGIHNHFRGAHRCEIVLEARGPDELLDRGNVREFDGIIARIGSNLLNERLKAAGRPVVNVSGISLKREHFPRICTDLDAGAEMAAKYFWEKGFRHFGYFGVLDLPLVQLQQTSFRRHVESLGGRCLVHASRGEGRLLGKWLSSAPKPFALFTWNAQGAQMALRACREHGLSVPGDVAILSGTDDSLLCEVSHVPISGIQVSGGEIGSKSAQLLLSLMDGANAPKHPELLPPVRVIERLSTQILAVGDPQVVKALEFIRERAFGRLGVDDISRHAGLSRRVLERRFETLLSRTPAEQIRQVRISKAEELLTKTNLSIPDVASASGFGSPEYMAYVFRGTTGISPLQYRKRYGP